MTRGDALRDLTLADAADAIRNGRVKSVDLTRAVLDRIETMNPKTNAFITVTADLAMEQAGQADRDVAAGAPTGVLHGVPVSLKDLIDTAGVPTTAASKILAGRVPDTDAEVVTRLRAAGAVIVGKTSLHEFAFGVTNVNPHYGPVRNPWDLDRISGGSSGGSAVSVALGMALGSLGSDTGGSIRIPSALCGTVGLKPTYGRVSVRGVIPLSPTLDHVGPITRTVEDAALMLEAVAGFDPDDPCSVEADTEGWSRRLDTGVAGLCIGVPRDAYFGRVETAVARSVNAAIDTLAGLGAEVREITVPDTAGHEDIFRFIATTEVYEHHQEHIEKRPEMFGEDVRLRMQPGRDMKAVDYVRALRRRLALEEEVDGLLQSVDLLALPGLPITAPRIEQTAIDWNGASEPVLGALTRTTRLANLTGLPAIVVPCGLSEAGLPVGLQLIGRRFAESTILAAAYAWEQSAALDMRPPETTS